MGALTQGDRRAGAGAADMRDFNLDTKWGQSALERMLSTIQVQSSAGGAWICFVKVSGCSNVRPSLICTYAARGSSSRHSDITRNLPSFVTKAYTFEQFATEACHALESCVSPVFFDRFPPSSLTSFSTGRVAWMSKK
jgi:hypothetical protein